MADGSGRAVGRLLMALMRLRVAFSIEMRSHSCSSDTPSLHKTNTFMALSGLYTVVSFLTPNLIN